MNVYLKNKGYRFLTNASLLNAIGNSLYNIVFIVYASTLPFNTLAVSLASITIFIPSFFQPFIGHFDDKTKSKTKWIIRARVGQFLLFLLLAKVILIEPSLPLFLLLLIINVLGDCLGAFSGSLQLPFFKQLISEEDLTEAMGFQSGLNTLIQLIFQGLGAFAIVKLNYNFSLFGLINAITFLLAALIIVIHYNFISSLEQQMISQTKQRKTTFISDFKETMTIFLNNPFLKMIIFFAVLINLLFSSAEGLLNISLLDRQVLWFGNLPNTIALVSISTSVGLLLGSLLTMDFFKHIKSLTIISLILINACLLPFSLIVIQSKWLMALLLFSFGYLLGKINPRLSAYLISEVPTEKLGLTSGIFNVLAMAGAPLGQLIFLGTANLINDLLSWITFGALSFLFFIYAVLGNNKVSDPITIN
ncbi:MFS transporter [Vagococcus carniphilus]|uniref:MFS transporter n=1 Tax=Vagococcus carniphilus TaxID=218144 RepID=UPI00288EA891|nr:MFS transporter [Vagococcus carniphilus]MDT2839956.1 MFS transporter [Vagococcus carniphilus]